MVEASTETIIPVCTEDTEGEIKIHIKLEWVDNGITENNIKVNVDNELERNEVVINTDSGDENLVRDINLANNIDVAENVDDEISVNLNAEIAVDKVTKDNYDIITAVLTDLINQVAQVNCNKKCKNYTCSECDYSPKDNFHLVRHIENMHNHVEVQCVKCKAIFNSKFDYTNHSKTCNIVCPYFGCSKTFKYDYKFEAHRWSHQKMLRRMV